MSRYARVHQHAVTGIDAYEAAWDLVASEIWSVFGYNLLWFIGFILSWIGLKIILYWADVSWFSLLTINLYFLLLYLAVWELANILRFRQRKRLTLGVAVGFLLSRTLYLLLITAAYACLIFPGVYLHSRLLLHAPVFADQAEPRPIGAIYSAWRLTDDRFIALYALWIVTVVSKPACLLPIALGFVMERPLSGFAKDMLFARYSSEIGGIGK